MATVVDSLTTELSTVPVTETARTENTNHVPGITTGVEGKSIKKKSRLKSCDGRKPMKNRKFFNTYLSKAPSQVLDYCLEECCRTVNKTETIMANLKSIAGDGSILYACNNRRRAETMVFRNLSEKQYYVSLTQESLADIIRGWVGSVSDCFLLHPTNNHQYLKPFNHAETLDSVQESAEERQDYQNRIMYQEPENCNENQCSPHQNNDGVNHEMFDKSSTKISS